MLKQWYSILKRVPETVPVASEVRKTFTIGIDEAFLSLQSELTSIVNKLGKGKVNLKVDGTYDLRLMPTAVTALHGVFIHLIRNSVDHGIELPEEGKNEVGTISIKYSLEASENELLEKDAQNKTVVIEFYDDGTGLNLRSLEDKARAIGYSAGSQLKLTDILSVVFKPGFSTKQHVTSISGRGVGLDAVREKVKASGGDIEILSNGEESNGFLPIKFRISLGLQFLMKDLATADHESMKKTG